MMFRRILGRKTDEVIGGWRKLHNEELHNMYSSQSINVSIATGYGLEDRGVGLRVPVWIKNFLFSTLSRVYMGLTHPPIELVLGQALFPLG
jgi:hypothetical protein